MPSLLRARLRDLGRGTGNRDEGNRRPVLKEPAQAFDRIMRAAVTGFAAADGVGAFEPPAWMAPFRGGVPEMASVALIRV